MLLLPVETGGGTFGNLAGMKPNDRVELDDLRAQQRILRRELEAMEKRIERLCSAVEVAEPEPIPVEKIAPVAAPFIPPEPPPLPNVEPAFTPPPAFVKEPVLPAITPVPDAPIASRFDPPPKESFEQKLGAFWLVRIGVVVLLTGLVFLGNYAYQHVIHHIGPLGKVMMLCVAGGVLAGAGLWLERGEEKMRNFSRVLIAGGLAAIYYTTYAAHFVAKLQVIASPLLGGGALLALASGIAWFADRRKSETIALLVVLLSYYTAAINPVAGFSLFSNLLLTALAVFFLARHRWVNISYASLVATYASFGYWRFFHTGSLIIPSELSVSDFWSQSGFLLGYWTLFTVAVFLSRAEAFTPMQRTPFFTANNAAFFGLVAPTIGLVYPGSFSTFALAFGAVLLALSLLARRVRADDLFMDGAYLAQGLALVTIGIAAKFTGYHLALALAIESAVLLEMSRFRHGMIYKIGACLCAGGAFSFAADTFTKDRSQIIPLGTTLAFVFVFDAWRYKQSRNELAIPRMRWFPAGFVSLAFLTSLVVFYEWTGQRNFAPALALATIACAVALHLLRLPELALIGQGYLAIANIVWFTNREHLDLPEWHAAILIGTALALMHWWPRQRAMKLHDAVENLVGLPYAFSAIAILHVLLPPKFSEPAWMAMSGVVAVIVLGYAVVTHAWWLAVLSQTFTAASVFQFFAHLAKSAGPWPLAFEWLPIATIALLAAQTAAGTLHVNRLPSSARGPIALLARGYRIVLTLMLFAWCIAYLPEPVQFLAIIVLATAYFLTGAFTKRGGAMLHAAALAVGGFALVWMRQLFQGEVFAADTVGVLILLAAQQCARRSELDAQVFPIAAHPAIIITGLATLGLHVTHAAQRSQHGLLLTISWSLLAFAVLAAGFLLRERLYRQLALALFGLAVGRVFLIDVWKFETIYRILSFLILGIVLIVVSFVYNRYGDRLKSLL